MRNEEEWKLCDKFSRWMDGHVYAVRYKDWNKERIQEKELQRTHGDIKLSRGNIIVYVEEKAFASIWKDCLIELLQDVRTKDMGWFFDLEGCTHIIMGYYPAREAEEPARVYKIPWDKLKDRYLSLCESEGLWHRITNRGYGQTLYGKIPWQKLHDLYEVIWPDENRKWDAVADEGWNHA